MNLRPHLSVLAETQPGERRVALVPADIRKLVGRVVFAVEAGAGIHAGFPDADYVAAGAKVMSRTAALAASDVRLAVRTPGDAHTFHSDTVLISLGDGAAPAAWPVAALHLVLQRVPRISRAQSMDVLSSQSTISGYAAVIEGARALDTLMPMMTTAAGIVKPARMIALGAGVAGLQAIATARRLGAVVHGFDVRRAAQEQVESLGARFVFPEVDFVAAETSGGYAAAQAEARQLALVRALAPLLKDMALIVTSAQIPGKPAPLLIDDDSLAGLTPGAVIVDLAAETGGNTSRSRADEVVTVGGVRIFAPTRLVSAFPTDASRFFSGNIRALLEHLLDKEGQFALNADDEITAALLGDQRLPELTL